MLYTSKRHMNSNGEHHLDYAQENRLVYTNVLDFSATYRLTFSQRWKNKKKSMEDKEKIQKNNHEMLDMTQTQELFAKYQNQLNTRLIKGRTVKEHPDVSLRRLFQNCKETAKENLELKESNKGASRIPLEISENQKQTLQRWRIYQRQGLQDPTEKRKK